MSLKERKLYKLGDVISIASGFAYQGKYIGSGDSLLLGMGCVSYKEKFISTGARPYSGPCDNKYLAKVGDIVLATRQQSDNLPILAMPAIIPEQYEGKRLIIGTNLYRVDLRDKDFDTYYLFWLLKTPDYVDYISSVKTGTTVRMVTKKDIESYVFTAPNKYERKKIADFLWNIEKKIENNNKINANLEAQAQALFKSWFVDFEPFQDGEFEDSELGRIPKGWKVGTLADLGEIVGGSTPSKAKPEYYTDNGIAWLTPKDLSISGAKFTSHGEIDITEAGYNSTSTKLMPRGSVLFSSRAPIGYITIAKNDICTNQGFKSVVPTVGGTCYIYCLLNYLTPEVERKSTGSTFKEASGSLMKSLPVIIPPKDILSNFENIIKPSFDSQEIIEDENKTLSHLRDTLLPKLMSGEIEV